MTTIDRAYEAAARAIFVGFDDLPEESREAMIVHAKKGVAAFLTAIGQEVQ